MPQHDATRQAPVKLRAVVRQSIQTRIGVPHVSCAAVADLVMVGAATGCNVVHGVALHGHWHAAMQPG